jgi:protein-S-isoprenylcysteine O-methyltransferase Ste14
VTAAATSNVSPSRGAGWKRIARRSRVPLGFVLAVLYLWLARPTVWAIASGAVVSACGLALRAAAAGHVKKDREVTTSGPYRWVRHPLYAGSLLIAAGFAIASRSWWVVLALAVMFGAIYWPVILSEEDYLRANFAGYDDYARRVPRFVPWKPGPASSGTFSRELWRKHREYNALIGAAVLFAALIGKLYWIR